MKQILSLIFTLCTLIFLTSCGEISTQSSTTNSEPTITTEETIFPNVTKQDLEMQSRYLYSNTTGQLIRYDLVNKRASVVCPDPLCKHEEGCISRTANGSLLVTDEYLCWQSSMLGGAYYLYDPSKNEVKIIHEASANCRYPYYIYGKFYFSSADYEYDEEEKVRREVYHMYRYDPKTGIKERLSETPLLGAYDVITYDEHSITWKVSGFDSVVTDLDFKQERKAMSNEAVNSVFGSYEMRYDYPTEGFALYRKDQETGVEELLFAGANDFQTVVVNRHIFGMIYEVNYLRDPEHNRYWGSNRIEFVDWRDLSSRKIIFDGGLDGVDGSIGIGLGLQQGNSEQSGAYMGFDAVFYREENGTMYVTSGILIYNFYTSESFTIEAPFTKREYIDPFTKDLS